MTPWVLSASARPSLLHRNMIAMDMITHLIEAAFNKFTEVGDPHFDNTFYLVYNI